MILIIILLMDTLIVISSSSMIVVLSDVKTKILSILQNQIPIIGITDDDNDKYVKESWVAFGLINNVKS